MNWACWSGHTGAWELTGIPHVAHHLRKCHHGSCPGCPALPFPGLSGRPHLLQLAGHSCLLSMVGHLGKRFQCSRASPPSLTPAGNSGNKLVPDGQG